MTDHNLNRRELLKMGAFTSTAAFLNFGTTINPAQAQNRAGNNTANSGKIIRIWGNENPYGPPDSVKKAVVDAALSGNRYAFSETNALEKIIAARENVAPESVVIGTGSGEVLAMAGAAYGLDKGEIVCADPTFGWLMMYAEKIGAKIVRVPLDENHAHNLEEMSRRISANTKLVYVCNPNNPTSTVVSSAKLREFITDIARKVPVLVDEAYLEYTDNFPANSMIDLVLKSENVIVLRTFSKIYGMAGMRLGYGLAKPEIAAKVKSLRMTWLNPISLRAGIAALEDQNFVRESRLKNWETRRYLMAEMDKLKFSYAPNPQGNFIWLKTGAKNRDLPLKLAELNIFFAGPVARQLDSDWVRVTVGTNEEMKIFVSALRKHYQQ